MTVTALYEVPLGVCTQDPDRWTTTPDDEANALDVDSARTSTRFLALSTLRAALRPPGFDDGRRD